MYSSFSESTYYVHLADGAGQPLPTRQTIGITASTLKKVYQSDLREERARLRLRAKKLTLEEKRVVGQRLLARLQDSPPASETGGARPRGLRLYEVDISLIDGRIEKRSELIAEIVP